MPGARPSNSIAATAVAAVVAFLLLSVACAQADGYVQKFPLEITLTAPPGSRIKIQRPAGAVAGLHTTIFIATVSGQLYLADIEKGTGTLLNPGGDDQPIGGLCLDSRGPGTVYATGRESGAVFAFNRRGELLQRYQVTNATNYGSTFLAGCIQTRYQLIITDSRNPLIYFLKLADEGPLRGHPPPLNTDYVLQGFEVPYTGDWVQTSADFNAFGVEWTAKFNESGYVMNTNSGELFTFDVKQSQIYGNMRKVSIIGEEQKFPGALHILFDSRNENILYITMPHINAIAVVEFHGDDPALAKFIRMISSPLLEEPVALSEYGEWIFPVGGHFSKMSGAATYSLVQLPRHQQIRKAGENFTTDFDGSYTPLPVEKNSSSILEELKKPPKPIGTSAPVPLPSGSTTAPPTESSSAAALPSSSPSTDSSPLPSSSATPVAVTGPPPTSATSTSSTGGSSRPSSIFQVDEEDSEDDGSNSCFPASATVRREDGRVVRMDELEIADRVAVGWDEDGNEIYSDVFLFSHRDRHVARRFVRIFASNGDVIELTRGHYLQVNGKMVAAGSVQEGDNLIGAEGISIQVSRVERTELRGLYNPQTMHGNIVVDGILASTYTEAVEPAVAAAMMSPIRAAYRCGSGVSRRVASILARGGRGIERLVPSGRLSYL